MAGSQQTEPWVIVVLKFPPSYELHKKVSNLVTSNINLTHT
jgi:hypothetical protein